MLQANINFFMTNSVVPSLTIVFTKYIKTNTFHRHHSLRNYLFLPLRMRL